MFVLRHGANSQVGLVSRIGWTAPWSQRPWGINYKGLLRSPVIVNTSRISGMMVTSTRRAPQSSAPELRHRDVGDNGLKSSSELPSRKSSVKNDRQKVLPRRRTKSRSLARRWKRFALKHTWTIPLALISVFTLLYAVNPTDSNIIHHFIFLSYEQAPLVGSDSVIEAPSKYGKGPWDITFVIFYMIFLSFTREFIMQELLRPMAYFCGITSRAKQARFMEQMYTAIYFGFMGPAGVYVMRQTPVWYFNTSGMYESFPHRALQPELKLYYLFQAAYWAQQAIVMLLGLEKPRKDFKELVLHHIVTLALIGLSYRFHFTHMGIGVFLTHDISDFFLAVSLYLLCCQYMSNYFPGVQIHPLSRRLLNNTLLWYLTLFLDLSSKLPQSTHYCVSLL